MTLHLSAGSSVALACLFAIACQSDSRPIVSADANPLPGVASANDLLGVTTESPVAYEVLCKKFLAPGTKYLVLRTRQN